MRCDGSLLGPLGIGCDSVRSTPCGRKFAAPVCPAMRMRMARRSGLARSISGRNGVRDVLVEFVVERLEGGERLGRERDRLAAAMRRGSDADRLTRQRVERRPTRPPELTSSTRCNSRRSPRCADGCADSRTAPSARTSGATWQPAAKARSDWRDTSGRAGRPQLGRHRSRKRRGRKHLQIPSIEDAAQF